MDVPIVDAHVHVRKQDPSYPWAKETTLPPFHDAMTANDVAKNVIVQVIHYRWDSGYLASVLKKYPERFQGVAQESGGPWGSGPSVAARRRRVCRHRMSTADERATGFAGP
jgi:hypothetical protein